MPSTRQPTTSGPPAPISGSAETPAPGSTSSRRTFLGWLAAVVPAVGGFRLPTLWVSGLEKLDEPLLLALGTAILPSEIGAEGARRAAESLHRWIAGYRVGAEVNHAYGSARIRTTGAGPSTRWALQLRTLDIDARRAHGEGFAALSLGRRRALVHAQLATERATTIPGDIAGASHVALALLSSFYLSAEATDLCYEAAIAKNACRPLGQVTQRPVALRRNGGRS